MFTVNDYTHLGFLLLLCIFLSIFLYYLSSKKSKKQFDIIFIVTLLLVLLWMFTCIVQIVCVNLFNINPIYFDYFSYISGCFLPVSFLLMSLIFAKTKIKFTKKYLLLFIIPTLSLILLWTNNWHHLFYVKYSLLPSETIFGYYFYVHYIYTYTLFAISLFILLKYTIKNSGFFSKQAALIIVGSLIPIVTNLLAFLNIIKSSLFLTPITFGVTIICFSFAVFKFRLSTTTPIALQIIVDRISDSYLILNEDYLISDFNQTFITTFKIKDSSNIRSKDFNSFLKSINLDSYINEFNKLIHKIGNNDNTESFELYVDNINRYFNVEVSSIISNKQFLGILILFKDITQHIEDMQNLKDNQNKLVEQERLASLGQMIGGIAHNLKTPIMSISGAVEGLNDLVNEYNSSIGDIEVTNQDHHEIAHDMQVWLDKIKTHMSYMSDVITAVKGQAVTFSDEQITDFDVNELFKMVSILMKHELTRAQISLNIQNNTPSNISIHGNINSLIQVVNNIVSNAIQASENATIKTIDLNANYSNSKIIISVIDHGTGIPDNIKNDLFKRMVTTKGKNGTGLGLFMSYSNIKAHFNGDITFDSELGKGTTFYIILPVQ